MFLLILVFGAALLLFYPFTLRLAAGRSGLSLFWLPRVFAGCARPLPVRLPKRRRKAGRPPRRKRGLRRILPLLRAIKLRRLRFLLRWSGAGKEMRGECIISVSLGDIICRKISRAWRQRRL